MAVANQGISMQSSASSSPRSAPPDLRQRSTAIRRVKPSTWTSSTPTRTTRSSITSMSTGATAGIGKMSGSLNGELSPGTLLGGSSPPPSQGLLRPRRPITALSVTIAGSGPTYTITRSSGWLTDGVKIGDVIRLSVGTLNAANISKNLLIIALTADRCDGRARSTASPWWPKARSPAAPSLLSARRSGFPPAATPTTI
jgi:hypothetical protein